MDKVKMENGSANVSYDLLADCRKKLEKAIESTQDNLSQVSLEWVQLCSLVERQNLKANQGQNVQESAKVDSTKLVSNLENPTSINIQHIDITVKSERRRSDAEEFDSD